VTGVQTCALPIYPMDGKVDVDETYVGGQDEKALGRNEGRKQIMVVAVERKGKGVSRIYGRVVETAARKHLKRFMLDHIAPGAAVRTDRWSGYRGLESEFPKLVREKSEKKGKNFPQLHRTAMLFKAWLRGIHHSGASYLQYCPTPLYIFLKLSKFSRYHWL